MGELKSSLRELFTAMCCKGTPKTVIAVQEAALNINAFHATLYQMTMEYAHAKEYLDKGKKEDIAETQEEYKWNIQNMKRQIKKCTAGLEECSDADLMIKKRVSDYLSMLGQELETLKVLGEIEPDFESIRSYQNQLEMLCDQCGQSGMILALGQNMERLSLLPYERYSEQTELAIGALGLRMQFLYRLLRQIRDAFAISGCKEEFNLRFITKELQDCLEVLLQCNSAETAVGALCEWIEALIKYMDVFTQECRIMSATDYKMALEYLYQICEDYIRLRIGDQSYLGQ